MKKEDEINIKKFLSLVLLYKPETIGLKLDSKGWALTYELISKINQHKSEFKMDFNVLVDIVDNDQHNFIFNHDKSKIKANQVVSAEDVERDFIKTQPTFLLFYGTGKKNLDKIQENGLTPIDQNYVYLTSDFKNSVQNAKRYSDPIILTILAEAMYEDGIDFFLSENGTWMVKHVAFKYIIV